jgi:hypothetical protein
MIGLIKNRMTKFIISAILTISLIINDADQLRPRPAGRPKEEEYEPTTER